MGLRTLILQFADNILLAKDSARQLDFNRPRIRVNIACIGTLRPPYSTVVLVTEPGRRVARQWVKYSSTNSPKSKLGFVAHDPYRPSDASAFFLRIFQTDILIFQSNILKYNEKYVIFSRIV
jgi:hypothetical protein